jgi:rhodanese-related sulfurtransferase
VEYMKPMRQYLLTGIIQAMLIGIASVLLALAVNAVRNDGLPLINRVVTRLPSEVDMSSSNAPSVISLKDAFRMLNEKKAVFLDARDLNEFRKYHVPGAIHIEPGKGGTDKVKAVRTGLFIAYCYGPGCPLAEELAAELRAKGVKNITVMPEGWEGWAGASYPEEGESK